METPQPPQISVSGRIIIEGQLPAPSSASAENAPAETSPPWWRFWRWRPESVLAAATVVLAAATFFLAVFTLALVNVAFKQTKILSATDQALHQTALAADKMRVLSGATERPWISVEPVSAGPLTIDKDGKGGLDVVFRMKNVGHSPAINMVMQWTIIDARQMDRIAASQKQLTTILGVETQTFGTVLFPDQTADDGRQFQFNKNRQWPTVTSNYAGVDYVQVRIVGVVDYRSS